MGSSGSSKTGVTWCENMGASKPPESNEAKRGLRRMGEHAKHNVRVGSGVEGVPSNNGKSVLVGLSNRGERSNYPRSLMSSNSKNMFGTTSGAVKQNTVQVGRLGSAVLGNGPLRNDAGHGGVQTSRAYQKNSKGEPNSRSFAVSEEVVGKPPLSDQAEFFPVQVGARGNTNRNSASNLEKIGLISPSTPSSQLDGVSTGNGEVKGRQERGFTVVSAVDEANNKQTGSTVGKLEVVTEENDDKARFISRSVSTTGGNTEDGGPSAGFGNEEHGGSDRIYSLDQKRGGTTVEVSSRSLCRNLCCRVKQLSICRSLRELWGVMSF